MTPDDRDRWDRLRRGRRTADFVRHLLDLEEREARRLEQEETLAELIRFQATLPPSWKEERYYDLDDPDDYTPIPDEFADATIDMREVLASWREADQREADEP